MAAGGRGELDSRTAVVHPHRRGATAAAVAPPMGAAVPAAAAVGRRAPVRGRAARAAPSGGPRRGHTSQARERGPPADGGDALGAVAPGSPPRGETKPQRLLAAGPSAGGLRACPAAAGAKQRKVANSSGVRVAEGIASSRAQRRRGVARRAPRALAALGVAIEALHVAVLAAAPRPGGGAGGFDAPAAPQRPGALGRAHAVSRHWAHRVRRRRGDRVLPGLPARARAGRRPTAGL